MQVDTLPLAQDGGEGGLVGHGGQAGDDAIPLTDDEPNDEVDRLHKYKGSLRNLLMYVFVKAKQAQQLGTNHIVPKGTRFRAHVDVSDTTKEIKFVFADNDKLFPTYDDITFSHPLETCDIKYIVLALWVAKQYNDLFFGGDVVLLTTEIRRRRELGIPLQ